MFILLDENLLSKKLKRPLIEAGYTVQNVDDMGWRGIKDTLLLDLAEAQPFDVFLTADRKSTLDCSQPNFLASQFCLVDILCTISTETSRLDEFPSV